MYRVYEQAKGHQPTLWAVVNSRDYPLALLLPVQITLMGGALHPFTTRSVVYGSVLCDPTDEGKEAVEMLLCSYRRDTKGSVLFTELRNQSDLVDLRVILNKSGFSYEEHLNYLINLNQPEETIWRNISKSGRQSVRTSRNKGTIIEEVTEREKISIAYQLLEDVYARAQVPLANVTLFEAAFDILGPRGMFKVFLARVDKHYIGTCLILLYKGRIVDWYAGTKRTFSKFSPGELLIWHVLQWGKKHSFHLFDFGGAGKPQEDYGPRKFKSKFGGELVNYGRNICVHAPTRLRFSQLGYKYLSRFL
jgi:lipid II:glycine glycyltransferase (peptidoglycan interpeptide bridge formation enzyme)